MGPRDNHKMSVKSLGPSALKASSRQRARKLIVDSLRDLAISGSDPNPNNSAKLRIRALLGTQESDIGSASLTLRERQLISWYDVDRVPLEEIIRRLSISRRRFYQLRSSALQKIEDCIQKDAVHQPRRSVDAADWTVGLDLNAAMRLQHLGDYRAARALLERMLVGVTDPIVTVRVLCALMDVLLGFDNINEALKINDRLVSVTLEQASPWVARIELAFSRLQQSTLQLDPAAVFQSYDLVDKLASAAPLSECKRSVLFRARAGAILAKYQYSQGNIEAAASTIRCAHANAVKYQDEPWHRANLLIDYGFVHEIIPDGWKTSILSYRSALQLAHRHGLGRIAHLAAHNMASLIFTSEDYLAAKDLVEIAIDLAARHGSNDDRAYSLVMSAQIHCALGAPERAHERLRAASKIESGVPGMRAYSLRVEAELLTVQGQYRQALKKIEEAMTFCDEIQRGYLFAIKADANERLGDFAAATKCLRSAFDHLEHTAYVRPLKRAYKCAFRLTSDQQYTRKAANLSASVDPLGFRRKLLGVAGLLKSANNENSELERRARPSDKYGTQLTARENEILERVIQDWTNAEIAAQLGLSERTVANHVQSIFCRLGVRARWQLSSDLSATL